jgi:Ca2+-binding RTX toxin-like protein
MAKIEGTSSIDLIEGGNSGDSIFGRGDKDDLRGNGGNDKIYGGSGDDALYGGNLIDPVLAKHPDLWAADGRDLLEGGTGDDMLFGGTGNDTLNGGADNDTLAGGLGSDKLIGGKGEDTFQFGNADVWDRKNGHVDTIKDFGEGDLIDLSMIDANKGKMGDQDFTFVGEIKHGSQLAAGEVGFVIDAQANQTIVMAAVDSKGPADFAVMLDGQHQLTANDFVL